MKILTSLNASLISDLFCVRHHPPFPSLPFLLFLFISQRLHFFGNKKIYKQSLSTEYNICSLSLLLFHKKKRYSKQGAVYSKSNIHSSFSLSPLVSSMPMSHEWRQVTCNGCKATICTFKR